MSSTPPSLPPVARSSFAKRASKTTHPLSAYLLRLMTIKKSNLCLSADVSTTNQLLHLADAIGPAIVVLKTHYDLISNWDYHPSTGTGARLNRLARRHGFLIFEDRKFADIGSTVQGQYIDGSAKIIEWSHITNVNMVPGKAVVDTMAQAAARWRQRKHYEVKTDISAEAVGGSDEDEDDNDDDDEEEGGGPGRRTPMAEVPAHDGRKASIVSITTVSQHFEPVNSPRSRDEFTGDEFDDMEEPPLERGLLILAQMSSAGNFMTRAYTDACVESAREHRDYVMGFVSQETLNSQPDDEFLSMTPGCQLPQDADDEDAEIQGDGKGQQYNTPKKLVGVMGNDIVIVGRGIIKAANPRAEAERYRKHAWEAYLERTSSS
jgi:uridine monophosphate synthetase